MIRKKQLDGLEILRVVFSVAVVVWHLKTIPKSPYLLFGGNHGVGAGVLDVVNIGVLLLAVPVFIFISCFIFVLNGAGRESLKRRLTVLAIFWSVAYILFMEGRAGLVRIAAEFIDRPLYVIFRSGGTVYYFFISLAACLVLCQIYFQVSSRLRCALIGGAYLLCVLGSLGPSFLGYSAMSVYWAPTGFFAIALTAAWAGLNYSKIQAALGRYVLLSMCLGLVALLLEYCYLPFSGSIPGQNFSIPSYSRLSLPLLAFSAVVASTRYRGELNAALRFGANNSLALYCLHPFALGVGHKLVAYVQMDDAAKAVVAVLLVVFLSYAVALVLRGRILNPRLL